MAQRAPIIRIFFSSTFADFQTERDALQATVFPELRRYCLERGARFLPIDLRWGISEAASNDQFVVRTCLEEIARCQRVSPALNFVALIGARYGSRLLAETIPQTDFDPLVSRLSPSQRDLALRWYRLDTNAAPAAYTLRPRASGWEQDQLTLRSAFHQASLASELTTWISSETRLALTTSVTEQEIRAAMRHATTGGAPPLIFQRLLTTSPAPDPFAEHDAAARQRLDTLLTDLRAAYGDDCLSTYTADPAELLTGDPAAPSLIAFCAQIEQALKRRVDAALSQRSQPVSQRSADTDPDTPALADLPFARDRLRHFTGQREPLARIDRYLSAPALTPLVVSGAPGAGKTSTLLKAAASLAARFPTAVHRQYFIGGSTTIASVDALLTTLAASLLRAYPHSPRAAALTVPATSPELARQLPDFLSLATAARPLVIVIDALDQLQPAAADSATISDPSDGADLATIRWLPATLPPHVHLIVSLPDGPALAALRAHQPAPAEAVISSLPTDEALTVLRAWLADAGRACAPAQLAAISTYYRDHPNPLGLRVIAEMARRWPSWQDTLPPFPPTVSGLISSWLTELEADARSGPLLPTYILGLIAAGKHGLTEDEILAVIDQQPDVARRITSRYTYAPHAARFPAVLWAQLYAEIEWGLTERDVDQTSTLSFYHQQIRRAVEERYHAGGAGSARHQELARYFSREAGQSPYLVNTTARPRAVVNRRMVSELAYQQAQAGLWPELRATLFDAEFLQARIQAGSIRDAVEDIAPAARAGDRDGDLLALTQALELSRHILDQAPQELPNQIFGRAAETVYPLLHDWPAWPDPHLRLASRAFNQAGADLLRIMTQPNHISALSLSPNGRFALTAAEDGGVNLWDVPAGELRLTFRGHTDHVMATAFSPDNRYAASGSADKTIRLWDVATGASIRVIAGHKDHVTACLFTPDGQYILSASRDATLRLWDVETGALLRYFWGHLRPINVCALSPDGNYALSSADDHILRLWDIQRGTLARTFSGHTSRISACAFSPDSAYALSSSWDSTLRLWDVRNRKRHPVHVLHGHQLNVFACAFSPDGHYALSAGDSTLRLWDLATGQAVHTFAGHTSNALKCAFSPDGRYALSASQDNTLRLWDVRTGASLHTFQGHSSSVDFCAFTPDGSRVLSASSDKTLRLWTVPPDASAASSVTTSMSPGSGVGAQLGAASTNHDDLIWDCAYDPTGRFALSASRDNTLRLWDVATQSPLRAFRSHRQMVHTCAFSPDGAYALSGSQDNSLILWDVSTGASVRTFIGHTERVNACAFSPDGRYALSASEDGTLRLWDVATGDEALLITALPDYMADVRACAFSPDGAYALSATGSFFNAAGIALGSNHLTSLRLWDLRDGQLRRDFAGHSGGISDCAFSLDGASVLSASSDTTLRLWDVQTATTLRVFTGHTQRVNACAFTADGAHALSVSDDSTLRLWHIATGQQLAVWPTESALSCLAASPRGPDALVGEGSSLHFLSIINVALGERPSPPPPLTLMDLPTPPAPQPAPDSAPDSASSRPWWRFWDS